MNLITKYAQDEIKGEKSEFIQKMEEDGFTVVTDHTGDVKKFEKSFGVDTNEEEEYPVRKKKKTLIHDDFYRFQVKNKEFMGN